MKKIILLFALALPFQALAVEVKKEVWINSMSTGLPVVFCNSSQPFRKCFSITAEECEETAVSAARICLNKYRSQIPEILIQPKDGTRWGGIVGACTGNAYATSLKSKRIKSPECDAIWNRK